MSYSSTGTSDSGLTQQDQKKQQQHSGESRIVFISSLFLVYTFVIITFAIVIRLYISRTMRRYPAPRRGPSNLILSAAASRPQSAQPERGLDLAALAAIPRFPYARRPDAGPAECAVCLSEVEEGEVVRDLPGCGHLFHVDCIDMWLHSHTTCPVCRAEAEPKRPVAADVEAAVAPTPNPCGEASENQMSGLGSLRGMFGGESARALPWDDLERQ